MFLLVDIPPCHLYEQQQSGGAGDRRRDGRRLGGYSQMMFAFPAHRVCGTTCARTNMLDTSPRGYDVYECADGRRVAVGSHRGRSSTPR